MIYFCVRESRFEKAFLSDFCFAVHRLVAEKKGRPGSLFARSEKLCGISVKKGKKLDL